MSGGKEVIDMNPSTHPNALPEGVWQTLLAHAFTLVDEIARHGISDPFWTFGGGTVLMLRHGHRLSKDIDIFVPDPQYLGFVSPRLSDAAEAFLTQIEHRRAVLSAQFGAIDALDYRPTYDEAVERASRSLKQLPA